MSAKNPNGQNKYHFIYGKVSYLAKPQNKRDVIPPSPMEVKKNGVSKTRSSFTTITILVNCIL